MKTFSIPPEIFHIFSTGPRNAKRLSTLVFLTHSFSNQIRISHYTGTKVSRHANTEKIGERKLLVKTKIQIWGHFRIACTILNKFGPFHFFLAPKLTKIFRVFDPTNGSARQRCGTTQQQLSRALIGSRVNLDISVSIGATENLQRHFLLRITRRIHIWHQLFKNFFLKCKYLFIISKEVKKLNFRRGYWETGIHYEWQIMQMTELSFVRSIRCHPSISWRVEFGTWRAGNWKTPPDLTYHEY